MFLAGNTKGNYRLPLILERNTKSILLSLGILWVRIPTQLKRLKAVPYAAMSDA